MIDSAVSQPVLVFSSRRGRDPDPHTPHMYPRLTEAAGGWAPRNRRAQGHQPGGPSPASSEAPASEGCAGNCERSAGTPRPTCRPPPPRARRAVADLPAGARDIALRPQGQATLAFRGSVVDDAVEWQALASLRLQRLPPGTSQSRTGDCLLHRD